MTEKIEEDGSDHEPVSKRTRRAGIVASIGDPNLKDRSKVAPLFLTKKEKLDKQYKKETEKLVQSTKTRMNDWKSVIGVEKDASKVCPVFQRASLSSSQSQSVSGSASAGARKTKPDAGPVNLGIPPLIDSSIIPDPYLSLHQPTSDIDLASRQQSTSDTPFSPEDTYRFVLDIPHARPTASSPLVDLRTPCKPPSPSGPSAPFDEFPEIDKNLKIACVSAITAMSTGKHPDSSGSQISDWTSCNTKDWNSARMEPRKQHMLSKWLSKWKDEDTAVRRNKVAPILLVAGPVGCGKTSLVYTSALELNMQVLEVSPADFSWQSNGKRQISDAIREALQSRQVRQESMSQIVLIDDVDVLIKEDRSVLHSIASITDDSKRPLVLTCTNPHLVTGPDIIEISESFHIIPPTDIQMSFIAHTYQRILGRPISRFLADSIARHCNGDLRKLALASQMQYLDSSKSSSIEPDVSPIPHALFPLSLPRGPLDTCKISELIRVLSSVDGLPIGYETLIASLVNQLETLDANNFPHFSNLLSSACIADMVGDHGIAKILILKSIAQDPAITCEHILGTPPVRYTPNLTLEWRESFLTRFVTRATVSSIGVNKFRVGDTVSALSVMAQRSNSMEFNSRRLQCVLHQFGLDVPEIEVLRTIMLSKFN